MKILHTSDWHIGQTLYGYNREEEHRHFFGQLGRIAAERLPDAILVCGDVFDRESPSIAAQNLYVDAILGLRRACPDAAIIVTSGNHDSGARLEVDKPLWRRLGVTVMGGVLRDENGEYDPAQFIVTVRRKGEPVGYVAAVPYIHPINYPSKNFFNEVANTARIQNGGEVPICLMAHLNVCAAGETVEDVGGLRGDPITVLGAGYQYIALGHIHKPRTIHCEGMTGRYCGSPFPLSFDEDYKHSVTFVEVTPKTVAEEHLHITPLRPVLTLTAENLEIGLRMLAALDDNDPSYVQVLIDNDRPLDPDAQTRGNVAVENKNCRLCILRKKLRETDVAASPQSHDTNELRRKQPIEIALEHYASRNGGAQMPDDLKVLLQKAIELTNQTM